MALRHCGSCRILFVFIRLYQLDHSQCPLRPVQTSLQVCCNLPNSRQMIAENWKSFTAILQQIANILNEPKIFSYLFFLYSSNILRQSRRAPRRLRCRLFWQVSCCPTSRTLSSGPPTAWSPCSNSTTLTSGDSPMVRKRLSSNPSPLKYLSFLSKTFLCTYSKVKTKK